MTKQTNAFQSLIFKIHEQLEGTDAKVEESYEIPEDFEECSIKREIDILIQKNVNGKNKSIAIECRDHTIKNDITWVDSLVGKYKNLREGINGVSHVIAVSKSGFSESAEIKAKFEGIELRTLEDAGNIDWDNKFIKLGFVFTQFNFRFDKYSITVEPNIPGTFNLNKVRNARLYDGNSNDLGTIKSYCETRIEEYFNNQLFDSFDKAFDPTRITRANLDFPIIFNDSIENLNFHFTFNDSTYFLKRLDFSFIFFPRPEDIVPNHLKYESTLVHEAKFPLKDNLTEQKMYVSQLPNDSKINVSIDKPKKLPAKRGKGRGKA